MLLYFTWPWFVESWRISEMSSNAGGLIRWPVKLVLPLGFALLALQGISELIKRIAALNDSYRLEYQIRDAAAMIEFVRSNMAPLMFAGLIVFMLFGYPAAFSVAAVGLLFGFIGVELGLIEPNFLGNLVYQVFSIVSEEQGALLLSIPFFTFMGAILERSGLAEDLLDSIGQLFGPVRGGLSYAVIFVGAILGAITGTVAASVIAMAVIALPLMLRYGYSDAPRHRRDRRIRHHHAAHSAVAGADRARRPARPIGRRHVCRRDRAEPDPDRLVLRLGADREPDLAEGRAGAAARGTHAARLGAVGQMPARDRAVARADVPGARHASISGSRRRPKPARWAPSARCCLRRSTAG